VYKKCPAAQNPSGNQSGNCEPPSKEAFMFLHKRGKIWYICYAYPQTGKRSKHSTGCEKKSDAISHLSTFSASSSPEHLPEAPPLSVFGSELESYQRPLLSPGTLDIYKRSLKVFIDAAGDLPIDKISQRHVDMFKSKRLTKVKATTANIDLRTLKCGVNRFAANWRNLEQRSPYNPLWIYLCNSFQQDGELWINGRCN
jgi:hypothetical protein